MKDGHLSLADKVTRGGLAVTAGALLLVGAGFHGFAAESQTSQTKATTTAAAPVLARSVEAGRDSYADVVKNVAPAVVTIGLPLT